ncbi:MAG: hypothetical protein M3Y87_13950 [Myxococcota bacterium]|nr:hypothetical protein [Myxococcota bacterium]
MNTVSRAVTLVLMACMSGCFSTREVPPVDAGREVPDAYYRVDAFTPPDAVVADAFTPFPDRDAGPLGPPRGTLLALVTDHSHDSSLWVYEMAGSTILAAHRVPGTGGLLRGELFSPTIHVTRDGVWHVFEFIEESDIAWRGYVHRFDPAAPGWFVTELPESLRGPRVWQVVPEGSDLIFAVVDELGDVRVVRWNGEILAEVTLDFEAGATLRGLTIGGDGFVYVEESEAHVAQLHALDPSDLHLVRTLRPEIRAVSYRIDSDASVVAVERPSEQLMRWSPSGSVSLGPVAEDESVVGISRDGHIITRVSFMGSAQVYSPDLARVGGRITPTWRASSWAWADPAAR